MTDELEHGLEGVLVDESELSDIDGDAGRLLYRGYPVGELASEASFEEVLWLLWHGELPDRAGLDTVADTMGAAREVDDRIIDTLGGLAADDERPMAALRTGVSMLPATDPTPDAEPEDTDATLAKGRRITAKRPTILAAYDRLRSGSAPVAPRPDLGHAANFLYMLTGEAPDEVAAETFDTALTLRADHGLNASTFTAMTVASTYADIHSAVTAAVGALSGPLHGGANRAVIETLRELDDSGQDPPEWIKAALDDGRRIPGWGHRVYSERPARGGSGGSQRGARGVHRRGQVARAHPNDRAPPLLGEGPAGEGDRTERGFLLGECLPPTGDPDRPLHAVFAVSRVSGWVGHVCEYVSDNRLIRPRGRYVGPEPRSVVPIEER